MNKLEEVDPADEGRTYRQKGYWKRLRVVLAGPAMNLLIAVVLILVVFVAYGEQRPANWEVNTVSPSSAAAAAGLQPGDRLISIGGDQVRTFDDVGTIVRQRAGEPVDMVFERDGQTQTVSTTLGWSLDDSAAAQLAPLEAGDRILTIDGQPAGSYLDVARTLGVAPAGTVSVEFDRGGHTYKADVTTPANLPADGGRGFLGISQAIPREHVGVLTAIADTGTTFKDLTVASAEGAGRLFSPSGIGRYVELVFSTPTQGTPSSARRRPRRPRASNRSRPGHRRPPPARRSRPTRTASSRSSASWVWVRRSAGWPGGLPVPAGHHQLVLALFNLVPLLPFDGGHVAIATYEKIRGAISHRPYRADIAKMMPVAYAVVGCWCSSG